MVFHSLFFTSEQSYDDKKVLGYGKFLFKELNILSLFPGGNEGEKKKVGLLCTVIKNRYGVSCIKKHIKYTHSDERKKVALNIFWRFL